MDGHTISSRENMVEQPPVCDHHWCRNNLNELVVIDSHSKYVKGVNDIKISAQERKNNACKRETLAKVQSNVKLNDYNSNIKCNGQPCQRETLPQNRTNQDSSITKETGSNKFPEHSQQRKTLEQVRQFMQTCVLGNNNKTVPAKSCIHSDMRETLSKPKDRLEHKIPSENKSSKHNQNNQNIKDNSYKEETSSKNPNKEDANISNEQSSFVHVGANFTAYMTKNMVHVSINGAKSNALCDTGATVSCISKQFFEKAFPVHKPNINPCQIKSIVGVGGTHHPVLGVIQVDVKFGTLGLTYPFYVIEDLHHSIILGHDFMEAHHVTLDIKGKKMIIQDNVKVCSLQTNTGYARTIKPVTLPANSEIDISVKIARVQTNDEVLLEPLSKLASVNIMGAKCLVKVNKGKSVMRLINPTEKDIHLRGNKVLAIVSQVESTNIFTLNESESSQPKETEQIDLTKDTPKFSFDLSNADLTDQQKQKLLSFLNSNSDIFSEGLHDLGRTHLVSHHIETKDAPPVKLPPYKQNPEMRRITHQYVEEYKRNNLIKESNSNWHSPVVLVKKANSDEYRFAVDYRKLNKISKSQAYPIPRLSDIFDAIGEANAHFFTSLDLGKAFWQVPLSEESKERAAFITYDGIFEFQTMPFGLQGAPATWQHLMMKVLRGISWKYVLCYVDDVIIFSTTFHDHLQHLEEVFKRLRNAGLKLSPNKCYFAQKKLHYLGHVISKSGIETDSKKVEKNSKFKGT